MDDNMEIENGEKPKRKLEKTVLDNFTKLTNNQVSIRIKSGVNLLRHLQGNDTTEKDNNEFKYALNRIIRGLGSSNTIARTGFYTTLVGLINLHDELNVEDILGFVNKELKKAGSNSKGETADVCMGQILACGAIMRSDLFNRSSGDDQKKVLEILLKSANERTYLKLIAFTFVANLLETISDKDFQKVLFPLIKPEVFKVWSAQSLDSLYLLLSIKQKYPNIVQKKFLKSTLGTPEIICDESFIDLANILMTIPRITAIHHPVYILITKELVNSKSLTKQLLNEIDQHLQKSNRNKQLLVTNFLTIILKNLTDYNILPELFRKNFIEQMLKYFKSFKSKEKDDEYQKLINKFFEELLTVLKRDGVGSVIKIDILKKLLFEPGTIIFEKITRSKIIQQITSVLDKDGVKMLGLLYRDVVTGRHIENKSDVWFNNERLYAAHLLIKLLNHSAVQQDIDWRVEELTFVLELGLFREDNIGSELATSLKATFFNALDMRLSKLEDVQQVLSRLFHHIQSKTDLQTILRSPISSENYEVWEKTVVLVEKLEKKKKKKRIKSVFLTLFLHMGLQIFNDSKLATDSLQELFSCYERTSKKSGNNQVDSDPETTVILENGNNSSDPLWIEVVVDLFLNLLSHNSHLLRSLIKCVFPHLCKYLNATAIHQILSVLDPKSDTDLLGKRGEEDDEETSEEEDSENSEDEEESEPEDVDDTETVNDKFRLAIQKALVENGYNSGADSIDLDEMSDSEGDKLDRALSAAFQQFKPNKGKSKKQDKVQATLTHFRIRVLDLIEIYLDSTPSMLLTLEVMLPLLQAVEFSIRDEHQRPLLTRLQSCLKKLSSLKKFDNTDEVDETVLGDLLKSLLEKGTKNSIIIQEMGEQISDCCVFIVRCSIILISIEETPKKTRKRLKNTITEIITNELQTFFNKRDCLTPYVLFKNILQLNWNGNLKLVINLLDFLFNEEIKPFRRNQAAELLKFFYSNHRYLGSNTEKVLDKLQNYHEILSNNVITFFKTLCDFDQKHKVKERFICNLFLLLSSIKTSPIKTENINWPEIAVNVREYRSYVSFSNDAKFAFNKLCKQLGVSNIVKMKNNVTKLSLTNGDQNGLASSDEDDNKATTNKKRKKKPKGRNTNAMKLKKQSKELRLQSLSEGLGEGETFNSDEEMRDDDEEIRDDEENSPKRKKIC